MHAQWGSVLSLYIQWRLRPQTGMDHRSRQTKDAVASFQLLFGTQHAGVLGDEV